MLLATFDQSSEKRYTSRARPGCTFRRCKWLWGRVREIENADGLGFPATSTQYSSNPIEANKAAELLRESHLEVATRGSSRLIAAVDFGEFRLSAFRAVKIAEHTSADEASEENIAIRRSYEALGVPPAADRPRARWRPRLKLGQWRDNVAPAGHEPFRLLPRQTICWI